MTPRETAQNEAAKQAVALAFGIAATVVLILLQRRMGGGIVAAIEAEAARVDPAGAARRRMEAAQRSAKRWDRAAGWSFRYGPNRLFWACQDRAQAARDAYEAERL